jgi:hypothetical protein
VFEAIDGGRADWLTYVSLRPEPPGRLAQNFCEVLNLKIGIDAQST